MERDSSQNMVANLLATIKDLQTNYWGTDKLREFFAGEDS
jgi:hypothetical protein